MFYYWNDEACCFESVALSTANGCDLEVAPSDMNHPVAVVPLVVAFPVRPSEDAFPAVPFPEVAAPCLAAVEEAHCDDGRNSGQVFHETGAE